MKWKHNLKYWISGIVLTLIAAMLGYLAYALYSETMYFDSVNTVVTFAIGLVSFLLSVVALIFSVVTYVSIDSVNALSSMEGNVLCNENYNAEYVVLVKDYDDCKTQIELQNKLFSDVENHLKTHSKTCMLFTDFLQYFLDRMLWFAYLDTKREDYARSVMSLIEKIEKRYTDFNAISNGNQYVLREHIKLVKNVLNYQSVAHEGRELDANGEMLNIRGRMLVNCVSKTIYYDYLGLEYHKKALKKLRAVTGFESEEFLLKNMELLSDYSYKEEDKREVNMLLKQAQFAFDEAIVSSENDILWRGYISFNKARVDLLSFLVNRDFPEGDRWQAGIREALDARYLVRKMFAEDKNGYSFLQLEFVKEHLYAEALYLILRFYKIEEQEEREACKARAAVLKDEIASVNTEKEIIFERTLKYLDDVLAS